MLYVKVIDFSLGLVPLRLVASQLRSACPRRRTFLADHRLPPCARGRTWSGHRHSPCAPGSTGPGLQQPGPAYPPSRPAVQNRTLVQASPPHRRRVDLSLLDDAQAADRARARDQFSRQSENIATASAASSRPSSPHSNRSWPRHPPVPCRLSPGSSGVISRRGCARKDPGASEFVVATALRHSLPDFLGCTHDLTGKFLCDRLDVDQVEGAPRR